MTVTWETGDALDLMRSLPDRSVDAVICSPPFWNLRDYNGVAGQWGGEATPAEFLANLLTLAAEARRVLTPTGSLAFELGDTYSGSGGGGGDYLPGGMRDGQNAFNGSARAANAAHWRAKQVAKDQHPLPKSLCLLPTLFPACLAYGANLLDPATSVERAEWIIRLAGLGMSPRSAAWFADQLPPARQFDPWRVRNLIVWARCLDGDTVVYARTPKGDGPARLLHLTQNWRPGQWQLWDGQRWTDVLGWEATDANDAVEIEFRNGERVNATRNHRWPTERGLLRTDQLTVGDVVQSTTLPEPERPTDPAGLPDEMVGWFVGMYLAEGSMDGRGRIQISGHESETESRLGRLREIAEAYHGTATAHTYDRSNGATVVVRSEVLRAVVGRYLDGGNARTKHLAPACWQRSNAFLRAVLQGYLEGDGSYDAKNDRWRLGFTDNRWLARDIRVLCARIGATCRLRRVSRHRDDREQFANASAHIWRGEIRFGWASEAHARPPGQIVGLRASGRRRFFDVTVGGEPHLFALGSGLLTHNSNPPVGALGDKVRPATSYITVACTSGRRWFDLDAVRTPSDYSRPNLNGRREVPGQRPNMAAHTVNPAGSPPLDHWWDEPDGDLTWLINTQGSSLAHYAMWPPKLAERLVLSMVPPEVCRTCGEPRRRITAKTRPVDRDDRQRRKHQNGERPATGRMDRPPEIGWEIETTTLGWSDCGHGKLDCANCGESIPYATRRPGSPPPVPTGVLETEVQREEPEVPRETVRDVRGEVPGEADPADMQPELRCAAGGQGGSPALVPQEVGQVHGQQRLRDAVPPGPPDGDRSGQEVGSGASLRDGRAPRPTAGGQRTGTPPERDQGRQSAREPRAGDPLVTSGRGRLPALPEHIQPAVGTCPSCHSSAFRYTGDYRPGVVCDPFAGTGTTLAVADIHGRDAIGFDLDPANRGLYPIRHRQVWKALGRTAAPPVTEHGEQLALTAEWSAA